MTIFSKVSVTAMFVAATISTPFGERALSAETADTEIFIADESRDEILEYFKAVNDAGDGVDEILEGRLSQMSTAYDVSWWQVYGELLVIEEVAFELQDGRYSDALLTISKYVGEKLIGKYAAGGAILSATNIGALASLPITSQIENFAKLMAENATKEQLEAYFYERSALGLTHQQIVSGDVYSTNAIILHSEGWIFTLIDKGGFEDRYVKHPPGSITPEEFFELANILYEAKQDANAATQLRQQVNDAFNSEFGSTVMNQNLEGNDTIYNQVDWARVKLFLGGALAFISSNVSHIGSTAGTGVVPEGSSYNSGNDGLFVSASPLAETEWFLIVGDAATHLGVDDAYGSIASPGGDPIISLNNAGVTNTVIEKYFTLPAGQNTFSFSTLADFVTTEFPEFVGSQYDDTGAITLITPAGAAFDVTTIFSESVNASDFSPVSDLPSPMLKETGAATGGHTGFETVGVPSLRVAPGGTVTLRIEVENVGDTLYPSAVLISGAEAR